MKIALLSALVPQLVPYNTVHMVTSKHHNTDKKTQILRCMFLCQILVLFIYDKTTTPKLLYIMTWDIFSYVYYCISNLHHSLCSFFFWFQPPNIIDILVEISIFIFIFVYTRVTSPTSSKYQNLYVLLLYRVTGATET